MSEEREVERATLGAIGEWSAPSVLVPGAELSGAGAGRHGVDLLREPSHVSQLGCSVLGEQRVSVGQTLLI